MKSDQLKKSSAIKEIAFQAILLVVVFTFYAITRRSPKVEEFEFVFFANLSVTALIIEYVFLPQFFYRKKYITFTIAVLLIILAAFLIEELVLERIYFPDTRGSHFAPILYTLPSILPVVAILVGFKFAWDAYGKQREVEELKEAVKESELQFLKSQINPHFLFNNLNNLYAHAIENSPKTPEIILELSAVLRYMLYDCKAEHVPLYKEVEQLRNFIKISELQIEERGIVSFSFENEKLDFQIAPLLLIVFIENSFKHSTASQSKDISISVILKVSDEGILEFRCINSFEEQTNVDSLSSGIGLKNVKKRLELLYPDKHELRISNDANRFEVFLKLKLDSKPL